MREIVAHLTSASVMEQGAPIRSIRKTGENGDVHEERTWRERLHVNGDGYVFIPAMAIKIMLAECARFLSETVPGKGKATYTKHFEAGVMVLDDIVLNVKADDVQANRVFVPSDGKKGGGSRVWKNFPCIPAWEADVSILLVDPVLIAKPEKVKEYLEHAGKFIGLGVFRPRNGGTHGRFAVSNFKAKEDR